MEQKQGGLSIPQFSLEQSLGVLSFAGNRFRRLMDFRLGLLTRLIELRHNVGGILFKIRESRFHGLNHSDGFGSVLFFHRGGVRFNMCKNEILG